MGFQFLKRLFSVKSKKSKKQHPPIIHNVPLHDHSSQARFDEEEHEVAIGRLLRSTSARFTERSATDYATLPPLPHPINRVIQSAASSTASFETMSMSRRGTYNVTVHRRRRHASTEFPNANRHSDERTVQGGTSQEDSRVVKLRSDPSVASLLDLYDEHGKLAEDAFSNSPPSPKEERPQRLRSGSTLRQLLGASSLNSRDGGDSNEGDISWAERFLGETETASSISSSGLNTPVSVEAYLPVEHVESDDSYLAEGNLSAGTMNNPGISSMEVELSVTDISGDLTNNNPYKYPDPSTPQRASQVFGFLTRGKQSKLPVEDPDRPLPELPSYFSSPSDENFAHDIPTRPKQDPTPFQFNQNRVSAIPHFDDTPRNLRSYSPPLEDIPTPFNRRFSTEPQSSLSDDSHDSHYVANVARYSHCQTPLHYASEEKTRDIKVIMNGPTKVIVTAPTPSTIRDAPTHGPRGPCTRPKKLPSSGPTRKRSALGELSNSASSPIGDPFTVVPPRRTHRRSSRSSQISLSSLNYENPVMERGEVAKVNERKENRLTLSVKTELPSTPVRSHTTGSSSLFRSVVEQAIFRAPVGMTPSPASSSEMSPVGRQIMMDIRQQRMKTRESRHGNSGSSRLAKVELDDRANARHRI